MPSREFFSEKVDRELATARAAVRQGNDGMARVAARRAAGLAIGWYLQESAVASWGLDAMTRLRHAAGEPSLPAGVREAAARLSTKISDRFAYPFSTDPVADATVIVDHFLSSGG